MRLLSLNIACGQKYKNLTEFISSKALDTDIFCFQELLFGSDPAFMPITKARINIFDEIKALLPNFNISIYKAPVAANYFYQELLPNGTQGGLAIFTKKHIKVADGGGFRCYKNDTIPGFDFGAKLTGNCQWVDIGEFTILNLHGVYQRGTNKVDTPERIIQAQTIKEFMKTKKTKKVLCGDFNLLPTNKSLTILEEGLVNLIDKFKVTSTRSDTYTGASQSADYILVSPNVKVKHFEVLNTNASDHLPMILDFEI